ncbi:plant/protein isoform X2 [Carex rostrata]
MPEKAKRFCQGSSSSTTSPASPSSSLGPNLALVLDVKKRIVDAVRDNQEAVAVTTAIQEEILLEMGIDPGFGIGCLGKVNTVYENDMELMIKFYQFVAKEEMAIDEAELEPDEFAQKMSSQQILQNQQLEMLKRIRSYSCEEQSAILDYLRKELESANFDVDASSILTPRQLQEILRNCN